jgi:hypothetical protein
MRVRSFSRVSSKRSGKPLVIRGGLARTFGSLASFLAIIFLCFGVYLLADAFAHPVAAETHAIMAAAFVIALATILLFYVLKPGATLRVARVKYRVRTPQQAGSYGTDEERFQEERQAVQRELPYQRNYVDRTRIRT